MTDNAVFIGKAEAPELLNLKYAKGDLADLSRPGALKEGLVKRAERRLVEEKDTRRRETPQPRARTARAARRSNRRSVGEAAVKSAVRTLSSGIAREILRGVLGGFKRR